MSLVHLSRQLLSAYYDGEVTPEERSTVESHLASCLDCRATLNEYKRIGSNIREMPRLTPPPMMHGHVWAEINRRSGAGYGQAVSGLLRYGAIAAVLLLVVFGLWRLVIPGLSGGLAAQLTDPAPGTSNVAPDYTLKVHFNKPMAATTAGLLDIQPTDPKWRASWQDSQTLVVKPTGFWRSATTYTITVQQGASSADGAKLKNSTSWTFSTIGLIADSPTATATATNSSTPTATNTAPPTDTPQPTATATSTLAVVAPTDTQAVPTSTVAAPAPTNTQAAPAPTNTQSAPTATQHVPVTVTPRPTQPTALPTVTHVAPTSTPQPPTATPTTLVTATAQATFTAQPAPSNTVVGTAIATQPAVNKTSTSAPTATGGAKTATATPSATRTPAPTNTTAPTSTATATEVAPTSTPSATSTVGLMTTPSVTPQVTETPGLMVTPSVTVGSTPTAYLACNVEMRNGFGELYASNEKVKNALGCPQRPEIGPDAAEEDFQNGYMFWQGDMKRIYVLSATTGKWQIFPDTFLDGDPEPTATAPQGLYAPVRGFGKVWRTQPGVADELGWATNQEHLVEAAWQDFEHGSMLWTADKRIHVLYTSGAWEQFDMP